MSKLIRALLDHISSPSGNFRGLVEPRQSLLFPEGRRRPPHCHEDRARHREFHHFYEDLLS